MNPDPHRLLDEILEEAAPSEFRSAALEQTLSRVRRRRVMRQTQRALGAAILLAGLPLMIWRTSQIPRRDARPSIPSMAEVISQPIAKSMIIETQPGTVNIISTSDDALVVVETVPAKDSLKEITDEELLALVSGRPAVLVRHSPHQAELLFVNAEDQNGFRVQ